MTCAIRADRDNGCQRLRTANAIKQVIRSTQGEKAMLIAVMHGKAEAPTTPRHAYYASHDAGDDE
jgi:hypothetical protein